jgi:hypothetical protein
MPAAIVFAVAGAGSALLVGCDDDDPPEECTVEGMCPSDGRVCLDEATATPCCPVCPADGSTCPNGCILEFPPI